MVISGKSPYSEALKGGALPIDARFYVSRDADETLYSALTEADTNNPVCYVLAARQMGKSSLMVRTAKRLADEGIISVQINLQRFGKAVSEESLYLSLLRVICQQIRVTNKDLVKELDKFWKSLPDIPPALAFQEYAKSILQEINNQKIVIFLDEIQSLIYWQLQDAFLGLLKALSEDDSLKRLSFVLLGVAKPSDLLTSAEFAFNRATAIELKSFDDRCEPLLEGLQDVSEHPQELLQEILNWTGGTPFLTQWLCNLVSIRKDSFAKAGNIKYHVAEIVKHEIIDNWRAKDKQCHFQSIEDWFRRGYPSLDERISALNLLDEILQQKKLIEFNASNAEQVNLLISGLVKKSNQYLKITNPIYQEVFTQDWIKETQHFLNKNQEEYMPSAEALNREVFILVDQSASMDDKDQGSDKTRWEALPEMLKGDIKNLMREYPGGQICDKVTLFLFSRQRVGRKFTIPPAKLEGNIFKENFPDSNTFVVPTLEYCLNSWKQNSRLQGKKAFIIIYTDGMLDDEEEFKTLIQKTCRDLKDENELKIILLGIGDEVNENPIPFLNLDYNLTLTNTDSQGKPMNIFVFDLVKEISDIIDPLDRQLVDDPKNPDMQVPQWVKERHSEWYKKTKELYQKHSS